MSAPWKAPDLAPAGSGQSGAEHDGVAQAGAAASQAPDAATAIAPDAQAWVIVAFVVVTLIWGSTWIIIRDQLGAVPANWSVTYRFAIAGLTMMMVAAVRRERLVLDRTGWLFVGAMGLLQFCLNFNLVYRAESFITSGLVAVVFALLIIPNAVLGRVVLGQLFIPKAMIGCVIAMVGVAMLIMVQMRADPSSTHDTLWGVGLTLLGVLSASCANILQATQTARRYPMVPALGVAMLIGAALDGAFAWAVAGPPVVEWRLGYVAGTLYLGVVASALAFTLYFNIIRAIGAPRAAFSSILVPIIAMLISTVVEGYQWSIVAGLGAVLALVGLAVAVAAACEKMSAGFSQRAKPQGD